MRKLTRTQRYELMGRALLGAVTGVSVVVEEGSVVVVVVGSSDGSA